MPNIFDGMGEISPIEIKLRSTAFPVIDQSLKSFPNSKSLIDKIWRARQRLAEEIPIDSTNIISKL